MTFLTEIPGTWQGSYQFSVTTTPRRFRFVADLDGPDINRWKPVQYLEVDARGVKAGPLAWSPNGGTATFSFATGASLPYKPPNFRLPPDSIDRVNIRATSISVVATAATVVWINWARY